MKPIRIPKLIDDYPQMMLWSLDELAPVMTCMLAGLVFDHIIIGLFVGLVAAHYYKKFKNGKNDGYLNHFMWRYLFFPIFKGRVFIEPITKRFKP